MIFNEPIWSDIPHHEKEQAFSLLCIFAILLQNTTLFLLGCHMPCWLLLPFIFLYILPLPDMPLLQLSYIRFCCWPQVNLHSICWTTTSAAVCHDPTFKMTHTLILAPWLLSFINVMQTILQMQFYLFIFKSLQPVMLQAAAGHRCWNAYDGLFSKEGKRINREMHAEESIFIFILQMSL